MARCQAVVQRQSKASAWKKRLCAIHAMDPGRTSQNQKLKDLSYANSTRVPTTRCRPFESGILMSQLRKHVSFKQNAIKASLFLDKTEITAKGARGAQRATRADVPP